MLRLATSPWTTTFGRRCVFVFKLFLHTFFQNFFVIQLKKLNELAEPIILLLRLCDGDTPCAGKVYHKVFQLGEELSNFEGLSVVQKREVNNVVHFSVGHDVLGHAWCRTRLGSRIPGGGLLGYIHVTVICPLFFL